MTFLLPASTAKSSTTISLFGAAGSGKTVTAALIALGASKHLHSSAPVAMMDPENASPFIANIFAIEQVPLLVGKGWSFVEMVEGLHEAQSIGACCYFVDNVSAVFAELTEAQRVKMGYVGRKLPFQHREELTRLWQSWTRDVDASGLHCLFSGRLGFQWDSVEDDAGDVDLIKLGTKMKGEPDAGYEADLLIEMEAIQHFVRDKKSRSKKGAIVHTCKILKDRWMILNGLQFSFKDLNGYKAGDYYAVWNAVFPHFEKLSIAPAVSDTRADGGLSNGGRVPQSSASLFTPVTGESAFAERLRRITIASEVFHGTLEILWPGSTAPAKACKQAAIETIYNTRSWTEVETKDALTVEEGAQLLKACEAALPREADGVAPMTRAETIAWILAVQSEVKTAKEAKLEAEGAF